MAFLPEWGEMLRGAIHHAYRRPVYGFAVSAAFFLTILALNLIAEGLKQRWDVR